MTEDSVPSGARISPVPVESMLYYYSNISRETAEWILWDRGCQDGMYLLRESNVDYVLSLCYQKSVLHYRIKRLHSGEVGLCGVPRQKFAGPVELVEGVEGLACKPTVPCNKSLDSVLPLTHWGVTEEEIRKAILKKAREWGIDEDKLDSSLTENYNDIKLLISKTLHEVQPWFHGPLSRVEAEKCIEDSGHKDGKFLVRERDDSSYALCLSHSGRIKHYKIDVLPSGEFAIQDGQRFPSIMALVSHYTLFSDGLWCSLHDPCPVQCRRTAEGSSSQTRSRSHDVSQSGESRNKSSIVPYQGGSSSTATEKSRTPGGRQSPGSASLDKSTTSSKTSKFFGGINQRFSKLVATVAPQIASQTLPQNISHSSSSSSHRRHIKNHLYPSLSDDNLEGGDPTRSVHARTSPVLINSHPLTPSASRKGSLSSSAVREDSAFHEVKKGKIHKASSFDILPAFLSLLLYGEGNTDSEKKGKKKVPENCHKRTQTEKEVSSSRSSHSHCNGTSVESSVQTDSESINKIHKATPIPAPRLSLAKKISRESGPVYANREALATSGRSISLGESASESIPEEDEAIKIVQNGLHIPQPFIRSASSPSVVSHSKTKPQPPPRPPHLSTSEIKCSGSLPSSPVTPTVLSENSRILLLNEQCNVQSQQQPVPKPRKTLQHQEEKYESNCNSCASTDNSTSPTLTEMSEHGPESLNVDIPCSDDLPLDEESAAYTDGVSDLPTSELCNKLPTSDLLETSSVTDKDVIQNSASETAQTSGATSPFTELVDDSSHVKVLSNGENTVNSSTNHVSEQSDNSVYATLSGSSDVICSMSSDVSLPLSSMSSDALEQLPEEETVNKVLSDKSTFSREESDLAYLTLRRFRRGPINLDYKSVVLKEKIGCGIFGEVMRGVFSSGPVEVQFAIKMLKSNSVHNPKCEILKEAQTMASLDHPHIVRLIGVCEGDTFMLVMELAPLGPLNKYLRTHRNISTSDIIMLMLQVASAMEYLESKQFVHRDLAARNVLLVNESFVKISDFGMSRALGLGKEYYRAEAAGKWPLKWYAPECIYYFKFSSKSDVWSFGVTLWEALSYGEKPYQGMIGRDILQMFERNERLAQPEGCPPAVYSLMRRCWQYNAEDRPSFAEVYQMLKSCIGLNR